MKKVSKAKIAHVYATALYEASLEANSVAGVREDVAKLQELIAESKDFGCYLENPLWSQGDKCEILQKTAKLVRSKRLYLI